MTALTSYHQSLGAQLADDGIPLQYDDLENEYHNALNGSVLLDRSHEGRILLTGDDRFELLNRMSTNKMIDMQQHEGRPTIFTNPTARILYRVIAYDRPEGLLLITEPGQGEAVANYLNRNIFFRDNVKLLNIQGQTTHFAIHGLTSDAIIREIQSDLVDLPELYSREIEHKIATFTLLRRKSIIGQHWALLSQTKDAVVIHQFLLDIGKNHGLKLAGSLTYNTLRIRSGHPAGRELSSDYIPLEVGLWDEISFTKGCYTGQEIIARMESREKLAKTIVKLNLSSFVSAPTTVYDNDTSVGKLTSSVESPDGEIFAIAIIKTSVSKSGTVLSVGDDRIQASVIEYIGQQPSFIHD